MSKSNKDYEIVLRDYEIYVVTSADYWYVGSASGREPYGSRRFKDHMTGKGGAKLLTQNVAELGTDAFSYQILESGFGNHVEAERLWFDLGQIFETRECLNGARPFRGGALPGNGAGRKLSPEHCANMSAARKGVPLGPQSPEHIAKLSAVSRGIPHDPEWVQKIAIANTGSKRTPEQRANISASITGRVISDEDRRARSERMRGNPDAIRNLAKGSCARWQINRGKPCICGQHEQDNQ